MAQAIELPRTLEAAHALILELWAAKGESDRRAAELQHQLDVLARRMFGKRSEQLDPAQLQMAFAALEGSEADAGLPETDAADEVEHEVVRRRKRKGHGRARLSADLPREIRVLEPESTDCPCCRKPMTKIGEERSEQLHYVPSSMKVIETVRPTWACPGCKEGIVAAPAPTSPIAKGKATSSLLAHVAVSKYADHLPLNRQVGILARHGAELSKQTLCGWIRQVSDILEPVEEALWASILASRVLQADETPVKVLDPPRKETRRAYFWAYVGDREEVGFDFSMGRGSEAPLKALERFAGEYLQADAYTGYGPVARSLVHTKRAGCWAHARRKFFDARVTDADRSLVILALIRKLYAVEDEAKSIPSMPEALEGCRQMLRQEKSVPILEAIRSRLETWQTQVLPKGPLARAIGYVLRQWAELMRYTECGAIEIDNNAAERALRTVAVGRANWTFCGSENGGHWAARLYGLVGTCRLQGIDPFTWMTDVLERVGAQPAERMYELTPRGWKQARAATADASA